MVGVPFLFLLIPYPQSWISGTLAIRTAYGSLILLNLTSDLQGLSNEAREAGCWGTGKDHPAGMQ